MSGTLPREHYKLIESSTDIFQRFLLCLSRKFATQRTGEESPTINAQDIEDAFVVMYDGIQGELSEEELGQILCEMQIARMEDNWEDFIN